VGVSFVFGAVVAALLGLAIVAFAGCGPLEDVGGTGGVMADGDIAVEQSAILRNSNCATFPPNGTIPAGSGAWLYDSGGGCHEIGSELRTGAVAPAGTYFYGVAVGPLAHVWLCDHASGDSVPSPKGKWPQWVDPCFVNQTSGLALRTDGPFWRTLGPWPVASLYTARAWLPDPPACNIPPLYSFTSCGSYPSDSGHEMFIARFGTSRAAGLNPDGTSGGPCTTVLNGATVTVVYDCPSL
jgi:hypothetical protein